MTGAQHNLSADALRACLSCVEQNVPAAGRYAVPAREIYKAANASLSMTALQSDIPAVVALLVEAQRNAAIDIHSTTRSAVG